MYNFDYDLVVIGGTAGGLSVAISSLRSGLPLVRVLEAAHAVTFPDLVGENDLDVGYGDTVLSIETDKGVLLVTSNKRQYRTRACLVAERGPLPHWSPPIPVPDLSCIGIDSLPSHPENHDVLVVGYTDHAVELTATAAAAGGRVVLAAGGMDPSLLSPVASRELRRLEHERQATILYRSVPTQIGAIDGYPMAFFDDRRTPDLQFDQVVFASHRANLTPEDVGLSDEALDSGLVWFLGEPEAESVRTTAPGWRIDREMAGACFPELGLENAVSPQSRRQRHNGVIVELRNETYNATITHFEPTHSDLWVLRVRPDHGGTSYIPGQYATLGLGFWEERVDDAEDANLDERWDKLIRRSYSISSRMLDDAGYFADEGELDELEFYIVLVPPTNENVPELTPRLALKQPGDRIYLGPKVAGRYTLAAVQDPAVTVVFLSTGTGEAPHNAMATELLRKGHHGPIVSAVSVRQNSDLGYLKTHRELESRFSNYHYLALPTREPAVPKRYIQDLIVDGELDALTGGLDPAFTQVYLCGNPAMIGLADGDGIFPEISGVVQLLSNRGFTVDKRSEPGNVHFEEYW